MAAAAAVVAVGQQEREQEEQEQQVLPADVLRFIEEEPVERVLDVLAATVRVGRQGFQEVLEAAASSPRDAAELDARLERADSVHGLIAMAFLCEQVEPVRARLRRLTAAAADPAAAAAGLIQREGVPVGVAVGGRGISALAAAAVFGNAPVLAFFLAQPGVDPGAWEMGGQSLVSLAAMFGSAACVEALLAAGADPNAGEAKAVFRSVKAKQAAALQALLADPRTAVDGTDGGRTLLGWAVTIGHLPCVEVLLRDSRINAAGPIAPGQPRLTCLHAAAAARELPVLRRLLQATRGKLAVDTVSAEGSTAMASALSMDWVEGARALVEEGGADVMRRMAELDNMTYLMFAATTGKLNALRYLMDATPLGRAGAEGLDAALEDGATALFMAVWRGHDACVRALLRNGQGADPNRLVYSRPILHHALRRPTQSVLRALLADPRLDLDARCDVGSYTALHYALQYLTWAGNPPAPAHADVPIILRTLLTAGANPRVEDGHGRAPLAWAGEVLGNVAEGGGDAAAVAAATASVEALQAALAEPERVALLHKARRLVDAGYTLPAVAAGARTRYAGRSRSVAAAPLCLRDRVAAGAALPVVEVVMPVAAVPPEPPQPPTSKPKQQRVGRKRKRGNAATAQADDDEEEEEEAAAVVLGPDAAEVRSAVLARVLGMPPPEGDGSVAIAQAGEENPGPFIFPRELFVELGALMGVRWAEAWKP